MQGICSRRCWGHRSLTPFFSSQQYLTHPYLYPFVTVGCLKSLPGIPSCGDPSPPGAPSCSFLARHCLTRGLGRRSGWREASARSSSSSEFVPFFGKWYVACTHVRTFFWLTEKETCCRFCTVASGLHVRVYNVFVERSWSILGKRKRS